MTDTPEVGSVKLRNALDNLAEAAQGTAAVLQKLTTLPLGPFRPVSPEGRPIGFIQFIGRDGYATYRTVWPVRFRRRRPRRMAGK